MVRAGGAGAALALLLAMAVGGAAADDGAGIGLPLRTVRFATDAWVDTAGLRRLLPLRRGEPVTEEQLAESRRRLEQANVFRAIAVDVHAEEGGAVVVVRAKRKRVITEVTMRGYQHLTWREVQRVVRLRTGSFYDREAIEAARQRLLTRYGQVGFPHAEVRARVDRTPGEATVAFSIREGRPTTVVGVEIAGDTGRAAAAVMSPLRALVGRPYGRDTSRTGERLLQGALRDAGYYEAQIDHQWVPSGETGGVLRFIVELGPRTELEIVGNVTRRREQLLGLMDLRRRLIVTDGTWRELGRRMRRLYQEYGYYRATVKVTIDDGDPRRVRFTIVEGLPYDVRRVDFVGNQQMPAADLRAEMNTQPRSRFSWPHWGAFVRPVFDEDLRRLWFFYREQGFENAEIVDAPITVDDDDRAIDITVVIAEGPRTIVEAVRAPDLSGVRPELVPTPTLTLGAPLRPAALDADATAIRNGLRRDGYLDATVEPQVTRRVEGETAPAVVDWMIERGPRREIGAVIVQGNVQVYDEVVLRQLPFESGDPLDPEALQRGQDNVHQLGTYRSVAVRSLEPDADVQDVGVEVVPRPPGSAQWGVGYNTRDGITGFGELAYDNIGRRARRITLRGQVSVEPTDLDSSQFLALIRYREPEFLRSPWAWSLELIGERSTKTISQYEILRGAVGSGFTRTLWQRLRVGLELQVARDDVFKVTPVSFLDEDEGISHTTSLSPSLVHDGRNDPFAPSRGVFESASLRYAPPGVSTVQFAALNLQHTQALPLADWLAFIYSLRLSYGRALSGAEVLPIRERYFLGGSTTVRGFGENTLGPTDEFGNVLGGDLAMVLSLEWRVPIIYQLSLAVFNDNGALFLTQCDSACRQQRDVLGNAFTFENFRHSVGPGLRYMTPVGPISLDYGFKLDRQTFVYRTPEGFVRTDRESIGEVHFSISGTF